MTTCLTCHSLCLAEAFRFSELCDDVLASLRAQFVRNTLVVDYKTGYAIIFDHGVVVFWNVSLDDREELLKRLLEFAEKPEKQRHEDRFTYQVDGQGQERIKHDHIQLQSDDLDVFLALSHALGQSIKLAAFEARALDTIQATKHLPESLARHGMIKQDRRTMAKIRGQLYLAKSDIILNYDLLDTPEFFWEYPEYQHLYALVANYLEISPRTEVLAKKLETIHELLEMLADEQKHQHSSNLEWIIIWLIAVEILMTLWDKWF
ncbi:MAG: RMD1 family protein [Methylococcales bacterium]|nr:RMD1 family protein [Methylococcales bacterium]